MSLNVFFLSFTYIQQKKESNLLFIFLLSFHIQFTWKSKKVAVEYRGKNNIDYNSPFPHMSDSLSRVIWNYNGLFLCKYVSGSRYHSEKERRCGWKNFDLLPIRKYPFCKCLVYYESRGMKTLQKIFKCDWKIWRFNFLYNFKFKSSSLSVEDEIYLWNY